MTSRTLPKRAVSALLCLLLGHSWNHALDRGERSCRRCLREERLYRKRFPGLGEGVFQWREVRPPR